MLDEATSTSSSEPDDGLPRPPRGRRAASRPAGPPEVFAGPSGTRPILDAPAGRHGEITAGESAPGLGSLDEDAGTNPTAGTTQTDTAATSTPDASTDAGAALAEPTRAGLTAHEAEPEPVTDDETHAGTTADAETHDETHAGTTADAEVVTDDGPSSQPVSGEHASSDSAGGSVDEPAGERAGDSGVEEDPVAAAIAAVMREVGPKRTRTRKAARTTAVRTSAHGEPANAVALSEEPQGQENSKEPDEPEAARPKRRRGQRRRVEPAPEAESMRSAPAEDVDSAIAEAEKSVRSRGRRRKTVQPGSPAQADEADIPADKEAVLESLVAAISGDETPAVSRPADEETPEETEEGPEETEEEESEPDSEDADSTPRRRHRRRGGRRRRRGADVGDEESEDEQPGSDKDETDETEEADPADQGDNAESAGSQHRRRRRRRRHSDETTGAEEDGSDSLAPRLHESGHNLADEVTGIEGSTRLEAKRQRRKQGRAAGRRRAPILTEAEFLARRESVDRKMIIRQREDYTQLAVLEDGVLVEHYVDRKASTSLIGNIYLGKVQNVLPSMEAAFIDIGRGRNAVLYAGEVNWDAMENPGGAHTIQSALTPGQTLLVQVSKDPIGAKGARLTAHISLPGRYVVYSPDGHLSGISRKLSDAERHRLKSIVNGAVDESASVIVRTAAEGATEEALHQDVERLKAQWAVIQKKASSGNAPQQLYAEPDLTLRIVRDLFTEDFSELVVAGNGGPEDAFETIDGYVEHVAGSLRERLHRWDPEKGDPFSEYRIDEQISKALERKVFLPSGGSLVIDRTEAMNVIDVNTGKFIGSGGNLEETVTKNNLEAAEEIVRQMRLRDLGGIIVVDFIDMVLPANRELLLRRLVECLGRDRTRHQVSEVTSLGLVQMTRKRIGTGLAEAFTEECEACGGRGYVRHDEPVESQAPADGGDRHRKGSHRSRGGK